MTGCTLATFSGSSSVCRSDESTSAMVCCSFCVNNMHKHQIALEHLGYRYD
uniref:Uncharacterized protein n=1 Tax=Physcomitrium patens TaxID=3218 RepID=A0A2K1J2F2_PHYPA|nr:hypothetical protein PHYPA_021553 [Physcomitrium patens]